MNASDSPKGSAATIGAAYTSSVRTKSTVCWTRDSSGIEGRRRGEAWSATTMYRDRGKSTSLATIGPRPWHSEASDSKSFPLIELISHGKS
jgi:hypothetical protein